MLAIAGGKGGCGKTTTALGLAVDLAERGQQVVAVDADRDMPDLHAMAGVEGTPTAAALAEGQPLGEVARPVDADPDVGIVPAAPGVGREALDAAFERVRSVPPVAILDCPAGAGPDAVAPLRAADRVLIVTDQSPASLRDATKTAAAARAVGTPVAGAAVVGTDAVHDGVSELLETRTVPIPSAANPLTSASVRRARGKIIRYLW